jgi:hypothetical protein
MIIETRAALEAPHPAFPWLLLTVFVAALGGMS